MIVLVLLSVLIGSLGTSIYLFGAGASWKTVALGYVAGGWCGLLLGGALVLLGSGIARIRRMRVRPKGSCPPQDDRLFTNPLNDDMKHRHTELWGNSLAAIGERRSSRRKP